jgi:hypothetical protein
MKKTFILASLLFTFQLVNAQDVNKTNAASKQSTQASAEKKGKPNASPEQKADKFTSKMTEAVGLDEKQKSKVRSLALDHFKNMETVRMQAKGDKEKIKAEGKNSRKIFNDGLKKVLSPTQLETWKTTRKEAAKKQQNAPANEPAETIED